MPFPAHRAGKMFTHMTAVLLTSKSSPCSRQRRIQPTSTSCCAANPDERRCCACVCVRIGKVERMCVCVCVCVWIGGSWNLSRQYSEVIDRPNHLMNRSTDRNHQSADPSIHPSIYPSINTDRKKCTPSAPPRTCACPPRRTTPASYARSRALLLPLMDVLFTTAGWWEEMGGSDSIGAWHQCMAPCRRRRRRASRPILSHLHTCGCNGSRPRPPPALMIPTASPSAFAAPAAVAAVRRRGRRVR
jgi:hypothetical protein